MGESGSERWDGVGPFYTRSLSTPIGELTLVASDAALVRVLFEDEKERLAAFMARDERTPLLQRAVRELEEYFNRERRVFSIPLRLCGTEFQRRVWNALREIPYGETRTYGQVAAIIGNPKGCRAVGLANNRNPLPLVVPCHRVIGANGALVGFGGGLDVKRKLLDLESGR